MKSVKFILIITLLLPLFVFGQEKRDCKVTFKISGERNDGKGNYEMEMDVTQRCYDFDDEGINKQLADDKWKYEGHDYVFMSNPSMKQDCAGYTFAKVFNRSDKYWITGPEFYEKFIIFFGKQIRSTTDPIGWGDIRVGDVLIYKKDGVANHITYVSEVNTTLGVVTSVAIETKDGKEGLYKHTIGLMNSPSDPLVAAWGEIYVYRIDPSKIQITEVSRSCDCEEQNLDMAGPGWELESLVFDPEKKSGKWGDKVTVSINENGVTATAWKSKFTVTVSKPPKFIKDSEAGKIEMTTSFAGEDDNIHLSISFNVQGRMDSDGNSTDGTVGRINDHKFLRNNAAVVFTVKNSTFGFAEFATLEPSFVIANFNSYIPIYHAKYKRKE